MLAKQIVERMLVVNPEERMSMREVRGHEWLNMKEGEVRKAVKFE